MGEEAQPTMTANSFGSRATLEAGGATHEIYRLDAVPGQRDPPLQPEGPAREPAPQRGRREHHQGARRPRSHRLGSKARARHRDPVHPGPGDPAGPTGVPAVVDLAAMREAMRNLAVTRRRSTRSSRPSWSSTTRSSPTSSAARTRSTVTWRSNSSATASASSSCAGARTRSPGSASCRRAPASCTRSTSSTWPAWS